MNPAASFLALDLSRRGLVFEQAAVGRAVEPVIVEKEFWVCWLLGVLFALPELEPHLVFKGGTSLSKVFGAIDRFSEDVDLSVSPAFVGADPSLLDEGISRASRDRALADLQRRCEETVREVVAPLLERVSRELLGLPRGGDAWLEYERDAQTQSPVLYFRYPTATSADVPYVPRSVKLELGSLTDQQPTGRHPVRPWVADDYPEIFQDWRCDVTALDLARSFWEKATILHAEFHRPADQPTPIRYARHYADFARLLTHPDAGTFMADKTLAARVVEWKNRIFPRRWARYDLARHGSFRFAPPPARQAELERDYAAMRPLFLHESSPFSSVMEQLASAERMVNAMGKLHSDS
jgi:hypothetical protein